jgi:hypothetical protein
MQPTHPQPLQKPSSLRYDKPEICPHPRQVTDHFKEKTMRVMVLVKATEHSEQGTLPSHELLAEMGKFNDELVKANILREAAGLKPTSQARRVAFDGPDRNVINGPFAQTSELVAGFWIWEVKDMDEAIAWVKRCPNPMPGPSEIEIRPFYELSDFAPQS